MFDSSAVVPDLASLSISSSSSPLSILATSSSQQQPAESYSHNVAAGNIVSYETWLAALASSACIGFTSLVPWLFNMTFFEQRHKPGQSRQQNEDYRMKLLLSFAVGAILGDIFFHLIPESFQSHVNELNDSPEVAHRKVGLSVIAGIFLFIIVEMLLEKWSHSIEASSVDKSHVRDESKEQRDEIDIANTTLKYAINKNSSDETQQLLAVKSNHQKKDLKQTFGALINYFEEKESNNNNNSIKNLNFKLNNNNNNNNNIDNKDIFAAENKLDNDENLQLRYRGSESLSKALDDYEKFPSLQLTKDEDEEKFFAKSIETNNSKREFDKPVEVAGYLSLIANGFDNFTHGLAIGASFLAGPKVGILTTFVIFIHEIPHEICDYAILVNSGFSRWDAVKAQSSVSLFGILGTATALYVKSLETLTAKTCWILPFSAGGFLYIALVNLLPEILDHRASSSMKNSIGEIVCVILGIAFMAIVGIL